MTSKELWQAVGVVVQQRRESLGFSSTSALSDLHRGRPNWRSMRDIEEGTIKTMKVLDDYCQILGLTVPDVLAQAIPSTPFVPGAVRVALAYERASAPGRRALDYVADLALGS